MKALLPAWCPSWGAQGWCLSWRAQGPLEPREHDLRLDAAVGAVTDPTSLRRLHHPVFFHLGDLFCLDTIAPGLFCLHLQLHLLQAGALNFSLHLIFLGAFSPTHHTLHAEKHGSHFSKPVRIHSSNTLHILFGSHDQLVVNNVVWGESKRVNG